MNGQNLMTIVLAAALLVTFAVSVTSILGRDVPEEKSDPVVEKLDALSGRITKLEGIADGIDKQVTTATSLTAEQLRQYVDEQTKPVEQPPLPPEIRRGVINGGDLAQLLAIDSIWKFEFDLVESEYTAYLWVEKWARDASEPVVDLLATDSGTWKQGYVIFKLPESDGELMYAKLGESSLLEPRDAVVPIARYGVETLDVAPLRVERSIHLVTIMQNEEGEIERALSGVHKTHDQTIYIKIGFKRGLWVPFAEADWISD